MHECLWDYLILFSLMSLTFPVSDTLLYINKIITIEIEIITKLLSEIHTYICFLLSVTNSLYTR